MSSQRIPRRILIFNTILIVLMAAIPMVALANSGANLEGELNPDTQFYIAKPNHGAIEQIADLISSGNKSEADLIRKLIETPQAVWFSSGTPKSVMQEVKNTVQRAAGKDTL